MSCLTPLTVLKKSRKVRSWANIARLVPCGKCPNCLKARANAWAFRLYNEMKVSETASFITLTYEDVPLSPSGIPTLKKKDFQDFMKRLRKINDGKIKYYACGEYGGISARPHYHLVAFNVDSFIINYSDILAQKWCHGQVHIGSVGMASIRYVTGYVCKAGMVDESLVDVETGEIFEDDRLPEFSLMSKNLGLSYLTPAMWKYHVNGLISFCTLPGGQLIALPRYYRDRIFSESEKLLLNDALREYRDLNVEELFYSPQHEVDYVRDQFRKSDKRRAERVKI